MASMATICVLSKRLFLLAKVNQVPSPTLRWVSNMVSTIPLVRAPFSNDYSSPAKKILSMAFWNLHGNGIVEFNLPLELFLAMFKMIDRLTYGELVIISLLFINGLFGLIFA